MPMGKSLRILLNNNNLLRELCVAYAGLTYPEYVIQNRQRNK